MAILLFSFLVLLYYYYLGNNASTTFMALSPPTNLQPVKVTTKMSNPLDQFEVHLQYPRVAHPMFWTVRILLIPVGFPQVQFRH